MENDFSLRLISFASGSSWERIHTAELATSERSSKNKLKEFSYTVEEGKGREGSVIGLLRTVKSVAKPLNTFTFPFQASAEIIHSGTMPAARHHSLYFSKNSIQRPTFVSTRLWIASRNLIFSQSVTRSSHYRCRRNTTNCHISQHGSRNYCIRTTAGACKQHISAL